MAIEFLRKLILRQAMVWGGEGSLGVKMATAVGRSNGALPMEIGIFSMTAAATASAYSSPHIVGFLGFHIASMSTYASEA